MVEQPSRRPASSSSVGSAVTRYWRMKKTPNALAAAGTMSAWSWLDQCSQFAIMMYSGMMPSCGGTIMVATTMPSSAPRPRNGSFAKAKPASVEVRTTDAVTVAATMNELISASRMSVWVNTFCRLSRKWAPGSSAGGALLMAALSCDAATTVQYSGKTDSSTTIASTT